MKNSIFEFLIREKKSKKNKYVKKISSHLLRKSLEKKKVTPTLLFTFFYTTEKNRCERDGRGKRD